jgi:hypothetical protein
MRTIALLLVVTGCGSSPSSQGAPLGGANTVQGTVLDFQSGSAITATPAVSAAGLEDPQVMIDGAQFTITDVPDNSVFELLAVAPPNYAATYSPAVTVGQGDLSNVQAFAVTQTFLQTTASGFSLTPSSSNGVLMIQLVDGSGAPQSGIAASNIVLAGVSGASGPHFLDANLAPSTATSSSASGWAVFFEVPQGSVTLGQAGSNMTLEMSQSPIAAATVTLARAQVSAGASAPLPTNVSFAQQVYPIFTKRGCTECHSGNNIGANLGNLSLDGGANHVYTQLVTTQYPLRVVVSAPATSKVLTMPSYSNPSNGHPVVVFTGPQDPDFETILAWITEGAKNN